VTIDADAVTHSEMQAEEVRDLVAEDQARTAAADAEVLETLRKLWRLAEQRGDQELMAAVQTLGERERDMQEAGP
jgi:hypothetical protein